MGKQKPKTHKRKKKGKERRGRKAIHRPRGAEWGGAIGGQEWGEILGATKSRRAQTPEGSTAKVVDGTAERARGGPLKSRQKARATAGKYVGETQGVCGCVCKE